MNFIETHIFFMHLEDIHKKKCAILKSTLKNNFYILGYFFC